VATEDVVAAIDEDGRIAAVAAYGGVLWVRLMRASKDVAIALDGGGYFSCRRALRG
jgi:hypothetical protein